MSTKTRTTYAPTREWRGQAVQASPAARPGLAALERSITGAGRRLSSWLRALGPRRALLGLEPAAPAPYRPHNRARMAQRRARRHMVQASRRANR